MAPLGADLPARPRRAARLAGAASAPAGFTPPAGASSAAESRDESNGSRKGCLLQKTGPAQQSRGGAGSHPVPAGWLGRVVPRWRPSLQAHGQNGRPVVVGARAIYRGCRSGGFRGTRSRLTRLPMGAPGRLAGPGAGCRVGAFAASGPVHAGFSPRVGGCVGSPHRIPWLRWRPYPTRGHGSWPRARCGRVPLNRLWSRCVSRPTPISLAPSESGSAEPASHAAGVTRFGSRSRLRT